ncbi:hypothetical protein ACFX5E_15720 [Flavobacterium sp. LS2P90]|uniref:Uncharacterized protein n=1 Tax=Flavobacterium xylosi TaxID=3230415 RepID=A0ABW6HZQ8_9FLAO
MNIICKIWDCKYVYNFSSIPNRAICVRCKRKLELNLRTLEWELVEKFNTTYDLGTDDELIKRWR